MSIAALGAEDIVHSTFSLMVDLADGMVNRVEVLDRLDAWLGDTSQPVGDAPIQRAAVAVAPTQARWGEGPDAVQGQRAMMAIAGNPPPHWRLLAERKKRELAKRPPDPGAGQP